MQALKGFDVFSKIEKEKALTRVHLEIPTFKIESTLQLTKILKEFGMTDMFDDTAAAFGGISDENLVVSDAIQKAFMEVDEDGATAAACDQDQISNKINCQPSVPFLCEGP